MSSLQAISGHIKRLASVLAITLGLFSATTAEEFSQKQVIGDLDFLVKTLKQNHPNLYTHITPKYFNAKVAEVKRKVRNKETYYSTLTRVQQILAAVCDEHTSARISDIDRLHISERIKKISESLKKSDGADKNRFIEFSRNAPFMVFEYFGDNFIATKTDVFMDNPAIAFNRQTLKSINGKSAEEIKNFLISVTHADGCADQGMLFTRFGSMMDRVILSEYLGIGGEYEMRVQSADDKEPRKYNISGKNFAEIGVVRHPPSAHEASMELLKKRAFNLTDIDLINPRSSGKLGIMMAANHDKSIYYIYSYAFLDDKDQIKRTDKLLRELLKSKPKHVILDLTDNHGGRLSVASHLLSYFLRRSHRVGNYVRMRNPARKINNFKFFSKKHKLSHNKKSKQFRRARKRGGQYRLRFVKKAFGNPDYRGDLTVLISPRTHSAGTVVASVLKRKRNARLVGYVNAGSTRTSCFGAPGVFVLPNTKISVTIPNTCFDRPKNNYNKAEILVPDIEVDPLAGSSSKLNSRILKAALDHITAENKQSVTESN